MVTGSALLEAHDGHQSIPNNEDTLETQCGSMEEIIGVRIDQMEDCKRAVEHLANENGFATVIRRSTKKDPQTGIYLKIELVCTRSRQPELKGSGKRRTPSGRVGCQWKGYIAFYKRENTWKFNVQRDFHNHYRVNAERIPVIRRHK
ncbi:hypothetical protein K3495_g17410, partial [Podosphaera aphanis]